MFKGVSEKGHRAEKVQCGESRMLFGAWGKEQEAGVLYQDENERLKVDALLQTNPIPAAKQNCHYPIISPYAKNTSRKKRICARCHTNSFTMLTSTALYIVNDCSFLHVSQLLPP